MSAEQNRQAFRTGWAQALSQPEIKQASEALHYYWVQERKRGTPEVAGKAIEALNALLTEGIHTRAQMAVGRGDAK